MELSSRQIEDTHFAGALRGYDRDEVDSFLAECARHTGNLEERTKIAEVRRASVETELAELRANIDVLLQEATDARRRIIEEATAEAQAISRRAPVPNVSNEPLDRQSSSVNQAADEIRTKAEAAAAATRADADRVLADAHRKSDLILEDAEASRAAMESQLAEIRQILQVARANDEKTDSSGHELIEEPADSDMVIDLRDVADEPQSQHAPS